MVYEGFTLSTPVGSAPLGQPRPCALLAHGIKEVLVARGVLDLVEEELHALYGVQGLEDFPQYPDPVELFLGQQQILFSRPRFVQVYGGEDPPLREFPVEDYLHVARALELLEYHLVHPGARVYEGGGYDGEAPALLYVPRGAEEPLRLMERVRVNASGKHLAARWHHRVIGPRQTRYRVEEYYHVLLVLDEPLRLLYHHLGDLDVSLRRLVEGWAYDLALYRPLP